MGEYIALSRVSDRLYLGAEKEARNAALLTTYGITAVANLTDEYFDCDMDRFKYLQLNQLDTVDIPAAKIKQFIDWMDAREKDGDTILVHCHMGISRTPALVIAWWMHKHNANKDSDLKGMWSKFEDKIGAVRSFIRPHHNLKKSILAYFGYEYVWPVDKPAIKW
jgi:hypothetical protein